MSGTRLNLARKYRPTSLDQVLGQALAVKVLQEAISTNRIAPAYLFSGPRGTGKTTCARVFAKAASCLSEDSKNRPCGKCESCKILAQGSSVDLQEIDGASHTGVDDVRSIIESAAFRPAVSARRVYIVDEVHMLSNAAFNALLKTLEEPPPHALFLFATTEQEKIPGTILSRVQRIPMQRLRIPEIIQNISMICKNEKIKFTQDLLEQVATAADGSLRDAQTLLEQMALLSGGNKLDAEIVNRFLGTIALSQEIELLQSLANQEIQPLLRKVSELSSTGKDLQKMMERLVLWGRSLLITQATNSSEFIKEDFSDEHITQVRTAFAQWGIDDLDRLFEVLYSGLERMRRSEVPRITLETTLIRAARLQKVEDLEKIVAALEEGQPVAGAAPSLFSAATPGRAASISRSTDYRPAGVKSDFNYGHEGKTKPADVETPAKVNNLDDLWKSIQGKRPSLYSLLICREKADWSGGPELTISFPKAHFAFKQLSEKILQQELRALVQKLTDNVIKTVIIKETESKINAAPSHFMVDAKNKILNDPDIQKAAELLQGRIESLTIEGVKNPVKS